MTERLRSMVTTPSENPPGEEFAVSGRVAEFCQQIGLEVELHTCEENRPNVVARWRGGEGPTVCYCSHYDVVPVGDRSLWDRDPFSAEIEGTTMHGRGTCDAKGPIAAALEAVSLLRDSGFVPHGTLELALVADEETMGFKGAGYLVDAGVVSPDIAVVGEPTSLRVVRAQRGAAWVRVETKGRAVHGSAPERGVSAIKHIAEIVSHLETTLPDITHDVLGGPSVSAGRIGGGAKVNIVPASAWLEIDRRTVPGEPPDAVTAHMERAIEAARERYPDIDASVTIEFEAAPYEVAADSEVVRAGVSAVEEVTGQEAAIIGFRGASDARFLADAGADVIVLGPGDIALAHTAQEMVDLDEVALAAAAYAGIFTRLLGPQG